MPFSSYTIVWHLSCSLSILLPLDFLLSFLKLILNLVFLLIYLFPSCHLPSFLDKYWFKRHILFSPFCSLLRFVVANRTHLHYFKQDKKFTKGKILHHGVSAMARESSVMALHSQSSNCIIAPLHWASCCGFWTLQGTVGGRTMILQPLKAGWLCPFASINSILHSIMPSNFFQTHVLYEVPWRGPGHEHIPERSEVRKAIF